MIFLKRNKKYDEKKLEELVMPMLVVSNNGQTVSQSAVTERKLTEEINRIEENLNNQFNDAFNEIARTNDEICDLQKIVEDNYVQNETFSMFSDNTMDSINNINVAIAENEDKNERRFIAVDEKTADLKNDLELAQKSTYARFVENESDIAYLKAQNRLLKICLIVSSCISVVSLGLALYQLIH